MGDVRCEVFYAAVLCSTRLVLAASPSFPCASSRLLSWFSSIAIKRLRMFASQIQASSPVDLTENPLAPTSTR